MNHMSEFIHACQMQRCKQLTSGISSSLIELSASVVPLTVSLLLPLTCPLVPFAPLAWFATTPSGLSSSENIDKSLDIVMNGDGAD